MSLTPEMLGILAVSVGVELCSILLQLCDPVKD
jgi:hypothetical protein